ncbi:MAG: hypothetical protein J0L99_04200 [Chitinophagales bacterium]|nr:hypothetical protein [Chitinophagales bacterium]
MPLTTHSRPCRSSPTRKANAGRHGRECHPSIQNISLDTGEAVEKQSLYQALVSAMLNDQIAWINDRNHVRKINQDNAVSSLQVAEQAEIMVRKYPFLCQIPTKKIVFSMLYQVKKKPYQHAEHYPLIAQRNEQSP